MDVVGILYNERLAGSEVLGETIAHWLQDQGCEVWLDESHRGRFDADVEARTELMITLGGDGSILRASKRTAQWGCMILGVNLGRVGFLTEATPSGWRDVLQRVLAGEYWVEERMMLSARASRRGALLAEGEALNDVVVGRGSRAYVVHLQAEVDGGAMARYVADGLIVATPTGSTAYALAAGGPVLPPGLRNILLVPVAPHLSMSRPIVLAEGAQVRIVVEGDRPAVLTVDGQVVVDLDDGDSVVVAASRQIARFARVQDQAYFYKTLVSRLTPRN